MQSIDQGDLFNIDDKTDTVKIFTGTYPDLSARLYQIRLNDPEFKQTGKIEISLTKETTVDESEVEGLTFGVTNGVITLIEKEGELEAVDFKDYQSLLVLLVNIRAMSPYTGTSTIGISIKASREEVLPYNYCQLELNVLGDHLIERNPPVVDPYHATYTLFNTWKLEGSCNENTFTGTLDPSYHPDNTHGKIKVTFDDDLNITQFDLTSYDRTLQADTLKWKINGTTLNKSYQSGPYLQHELVGTDVCNPLQDVYYYSESEHSQGGIVEYTVENHSCNETSHLKFSFRTNK
jgi:hypothetical protein